MQNTKQLLGNDLNKIYEKFIAPHERWRNTEFVEHNMGLLTIAEHKEMIELGVIKCENQVDTIIADYPVLSISRNGEQIIIDMGGNLRDIMFEKDKLMREGKSCAVTYVPRKYNDYTAKKRSIEAAKAHEKESADEMLKLEEMFN